MPGFYALSNAWLLLLLAPLVLFYFLKLKRPRLEIPSLFLWKQVINDSRVNSPFQRFKRNLLLLLQILLLILIILAAMQPYRHGGATKRQRLPILIDCSASMAALDKAGGFSRLALAKSRVEELIGGLLPNQELCLISFSQTARKRTGFTNNKRVLRQALAQVEIEDMPSDIEDALRMTQALARSVTFDEVLLISDGNFPTTADFELPFNLNYQQLPEAGPNIGITSLNARRSPKGEWDVFVRIEGTLKKQVSASVELSINEEVVSSQYVTVSGENARKIAFRVPGETASSVIVRLIPETFDSLPSDNTAFINLPSVRSLQVYLPDSMGSFRLALEALEGINLFSTREAAPANSRWDLVISDQPDDLPMEASTRLFIGIIPENLAKLITIDQEGSEVVDWRRSAPLLRHVELSDLVILDQPRSNKDIHEADFENLGYEILAYGHRGPLLLRKRENGRLSFFMIFHIDRSTLAYRVGFPILIANIVELTRHNTGLSSTQAGKTGTLKQLELSPGQSCVIDGPYNTSRESKADSEGILSGVPALRVGRYIVRTDGNKQAVLSASLLDSGETSLAAVDKIYFNELSVSAASAPIETEKSLWPTLALLAFSVLLGEWWFFHRRR